MPIRGIVNNTNPFTTTTTKNTATAGKEPNRTILATVLLAADHEYQ